MRCCDLYLLKKIIFFSGMLSLLLVDGLGQASHNHHHYQHADTKYDKDEIVVQRKAETISQ